MSKLWFALLSIICVLTSASASAYQLSGHFLLQGGGYVTTSGENQMININGLIGDEFNVTHHQQSNAVFGVGYLVDGLRRGHYGLDYGIDAFYLSKTKVSGTITQELLFTNLAYRYYISHLPVYLFAKGYADLNCNHLALTVDAGIGPNFMKTMQYQDTSLDGVTLPDHAFSGHSKTVFSAMAGIGLKFMVLQQYPLELGYRYFYLGQGSLHPRTNQILNNLKTGTNTAQALILTLSI